MDEARRAHRLLAASFGLAWVCIALIAAPGPAAWVALARDPGQAGAFFALFSLSSAAGAAVGGRAMDRLARRPVLIGAHLAAAAGFAGAGVAYALGSLPLFAAATVLLAFALGAVYLTRLAAGEMFPPGERARAVARLQASATFGAVLGPLLLVAAQPLGRLLGRSPDGLVWFVGPPLFLACALLVALAPEPLVLARRVASAGPAQAPDAPIPARPLLVGVLALACAQGAMVTVMGVTGAALRHAGHGAGVTAAVMVSHFLGMFALSTLVGRMADRTGRRPTILAGLGTMAAGGLLVALLDGPAGLAAGLLLVGLGWSFAYIGGTVVLADVVPAARRARVLGLTDFGTALFAAAASWVGGWWYGGHGLPGLGLLAILVVAAPFLLALPLRERKPGEYVSAGASAAGSGR